VTTVRELLRQCGEGRADAQLHIGAFVDDFRRAYAAEREMMIADGPERSGNLEGLISAIVSALCRESGMAPPGWVERIHSPEPFFVFPARGFALRLRLMLESPPPFRARNVFVPENYLARA
jgi:hypothetical protein